MEEIGSGDAGVDGDAGHLRVRGAEFAIELEGEIEIGEL